MGHTNRTIIDCQECGQPMTPDARHYGESYCNDCGATFVDPRNKMNWREERKRRLRDDRKELPL